MTRSSAPDRSVIAAPRPVTPLGILASKLADLSRRLDAADGVDAAIKAELAGASELAAGLDPYLSRWTTAESPDLTSLVERTGATDWSRRPESSVFLEQEMLSGHVEGQTLQMLVHATRAQRVLEIGMFTGYAALAMAEALPADGVVVTCEIDEEVAGFARRCFGESSAGHKIDVRVGAALATLQELADSGDCFDLIFIDADKAGYLDYLDVVLSTGLLAAHGLICADNTLMQGEPWSGTTMSKNGLAIADFNQAVAADPRTAQVIIPLRDGLTLIRQLSA